jgi:hypothetical protein
VLPGLPMLSDVMRCLMYSHSYDERHRARAIFAQLSADARSKLMAADYR